MKQPGTMIHTDIFDLVKGHCALHVYLAIMREATEDVPGAVMSRKELAEAAGISLGTLLRGIKYLEELDLLKVIHRFAPLDWDGNEDDVTSQRDADHPLQLPNFHQIRLYPPAS